jgi:Tfp pilus assembly protein PilN
MSAAANNINITGRATSFHAVTAFYNNLTNAGYFDDVTLGHTFEVVEGVQFSLNCKFALKADATGQEEAPRG